ncbi:MAG TPA: C40 family peptidase [Eoetvoesiella sp.]
MPPHRLSTLISNFISRNFWRGSKCLLLATTIAIAGCATNNENDSYSARATRDNYLAKTKADPLGAYLAGNEFSGYSSSQYPNATLNPRALASTALNFLGTKYKLGGETPYTGFDCSGLVTYAAEKSLGLKLPRTSAEIAREGKSVKLTDLKKGDLVFFNTLGRRYSHVGIYLGNKKFVHAPRTGAVVRVESMDIAYWKKRYNGARRLDVNSPAETLALK